MKNGFSIAAVTAALAASVAAQTPSASDFPSCSINCFTSTLSTDGCDETDFVCHCGLPTLYSNISACVYKVCDATDSETFLDGFATSCAALGVTMEGSNVTSTSSSSTATATAESGAVGLAITQMGSIAAAVLGLALLM